MSVSKCGFGTEERGTGVNRQAVCNFSLSQSRADVMALLEALLILCVALVGSAWTSSVQRNCRMDPVPVDLKPLPSPDGFWTPDFNLKGVEKVVVGPGPEDVAVDSSGNVYTGLADGWIKRIGLDERVENFTHYEGGLILGIAMGPGDELYYADAFQGLFVVFKDGVVRLLSNEADGTPICDGLDVAKDGTVYFSDVSFKYGYKELRLDAMEGRSNGRILKYDPSTKITSVVTKSLWFPNGVALSEDEDFLLISETWRARIVRYWLQGEKQGTLETFVDNLPGHPDNIRCNEAEKLFYIGIVKKRSRASDWLMRSSWKWLRCLMTSLAIKGIPRPDYRGMLIVVSPDGELVKEYEDPSGKAINFITGGNKAGDFVYISGLGRNFLGRLKV